MKKIIVILLVLLPLQLSAEYYSVKVRGADVGYIKVTEQPTKYETAEKAILRETWTVFKIRTGTNNAFNYLLKEKSITNEENHETLLYFLRYQKGTEWGEQQYTFKNNNIELVVIQGAQPEKKSFPLQKGTFVITDYFSVLPFIRKTGQFPLNFTSIDPKKITERPILERTTVTPKGLRTIDVLGKTKKSYRYHVQIGNHDMSYWVSLDKKKVFKIEARDGTSIYLSKPEDAKNIEFLTPQKGLENIRPFPYKIGQDYQYAFFAGEKKIGTLQFVVSKKDNLFRIISKADLSENTSSTSETLYDESLRPVFYLSQEERKLPKRLTQIACEFESAGVKERLQQDDKVVERLVPLPPNFVFLDNNSLHHFAVFVSQLPFKEGVNVTLDIFHPRRMSTNEGTFTFEGMNKEGYGVFKLKTDYHTVTMWVSSKGHLVRYIQEKMGIEARLQVKRD